MAVCKVPFAKPLRQMLAEARSVVDISLMDSRKEAQVARGWSPVRGMQLAEPSEERGAAVHVDGLAGHGAGLFGAQEQRGFCNFFRRLRAALQQAIQKTS